MKLYYFADGCSLASHISLREAGIAVEPVKVDVQTRLTERGEPFGKINPKGYVPMLVFDDGSELTENVAILDWIAQQSPALKPASEMARTRQMEALAFISTEIHKAFLALMFLPGDEAKPLLAQSISGRFATLAKELTGDYVLGDRFCVADAFLYVMLRWTAGNGIVVDEVFGSYIRRIETRPSVRAALAAEGIDAFA